MIKLQKELEVILKSDDANNDKLKKICGCLRNNISYFNWVGFYFKHETEPKLLLGPYEGAETEHVEIPFGKGICGQVAVSDETFCVPDVSEQDNYLSCSIETKSEVVVPIIKKGENIGQIDIDSHTINPFTTDDIRMLEWLCNELSQIL